MTEDYNNAIPPSAAPRQEERLAPESSVAGEREKPLEYNTSREPLRIREYGRNVLKMTEHLRSIPDKAERTRQAAAIVKVMELLNPQVRTLENWEHKLWDQLYIIAGFDLDIDSPYDPPKKEDFETRPVPLPMKDTKIKATHYGRNIENILNLIASEPDGAVKDQLIHDIAVYMRQQYLIWNKDSVSDETIFSDIYKLSDGKLRVPEGMSLGKVSENADFSRPGMSPQTAQNRKHNKPGKKNRRR